MALFRLNNVPYSWESCTIRLDNEALSAVLSIDYAHNRERPLLYGNNRSGRPVGKPSGKYTVEPLSLKIRQAEATDVLVYLTTKGLGSYGNADFTITVQVLETAALALPLVVLIENCAVTGVKTSLAPDGDGNAVEFTIQPESISENGMTLYDRTRDLIP